eukprot:250667-Prymnesium_polylepis.1
MASGMQHRFQIRSVRPDVRGPLRYRRHDAVLIAGPMFRFEGVCTAKRRKRRTTDSHLPHACRPPPAASTGSAVVRNPRALTLPAASAGEDAHALGRDVTVDDLDGARLDRAVQLNDVVLERVAEGEPLDQHVLRLTQPVDPPRRLHLGRCGRRTTAHTLIGPASLRRARECGGWRVER